jgi:hypothetical protein
MAAGNGRIRYEVHCSGVIGKALRQLHRRASRQGRGTAVVAAFRKVIEHLESDPLNAGEAAYALPGLHLEVRTIVVSPLSVDFAVNAAHRLVFIKSVHLLTQRGS